MEVVTHKNAALVEESTASLTSVDQQVEQLLKVIAFFKTSAQSFVAAPARADPKRQQKRLQREFPAQAPSPAPAPAPAAKAKSIASAAPKATPATPLVKAAASGGAPVDWSEF